MSTFVITVRQSVYESFVISAKTPQAAAYEAKKRMGETNWDEDDFEYDVVSDTELALSVLDIETENTVNGD